MSKSIEILDKTGLGYLWGKITALVSKKATKSTSLSGYGITDAYTKKEIDTALGGKQATLTFDSTPTANSSNPVTSSGIKSAIDTAASNKADKSTTLSGYGITNAYTKTEVDNAVSPKANTASPTFTGTPQAPTAAAGNNSTQIATTAFVTKAVSNAVGGVTSISYSIVDSLPSTGDAGTIYLVSNGGTGKNVYDEYLFVNNAFEKIGTTDVDLSGYEKAADIMAIANTEIDSICV